MELVIDNNALRPFFFFDMDGTLVNCGCYYKAATKQGAEFIHNVTGMPTEIARELMEAVDLAAVKSLPTEVGFLRNRYPSSFSKSLDVAASIMGVEATVEEKEAVFAIGDAVFEAPYAPFFGAVGAVQMLSNMGFGVALWTKGDHDVQMSKVKRNGFDQLFDFVNVTMRKDEETLANYMSVIGADPKLSYMVGDSLKDDIAPAQALGLKTVWVEEPSENRWSYNHHTVSPDYCVASVVEIANFVPRAAVEAG